MIIFRFLFELREKSEFKFKINITRNEMREMIARWEEWSVVVTDRQIDTQQLGERVTSVDDVKATTLKENKKEKKEHKQLYYL